MQKNRLCLPIAGMLTLQLAGCASPLLVSKQVNPPPSANTDPTPMEGLVYALPKAQLKFVAQRKQVDADDVAKAKKAATEAEAEVESLKKTKKEADAALKTASEKLKNAPPAAQQELTLQEALAQAWVNVLAKRIKAAESAAQQAQSKAELLSSQKGQWTETAELTFLPPVPDPNYRLVAKIDPGLARDDNIKISVANGLLSTSNSTSTDQTAEILLGFARIAGARKSPAVSELVAATEALRLPIDKDKKPPVEAPPPRCRAYRYAVIVDPTNAAEVDKANEQLKNMQGVVSALKLEVEDPPKKGGALKMESPGYMYRAPLALRVRAQYDEKSTANDCVELSMLTGAYEAAVVPDSSQVFALPMEARAFTKTVLNTTFKDGMLLDHQIDRPSQMAAIVRLPVDLLKAVLSVPAEIIKLRVDYQSESASLVEARTKLLKAQLDLLNAQQALDDAKP
jgi:hypothetical protein